MEYGYVRGERKYEMKICEKKAKEQKKTSYNESRWEMLKEKTGEAAKKGM